MRRIFTVKASTSAKRKKIHASVNDNGIYLNAGDYIRFTIDGKPAIGQIESILYSNDYNGNMIYRDAFNSGMILWNINYLYDEFYDRQEQMKFIEHVPANEIENVQKMSRVEFINRLDELTGRSNDDYKDVEFLNFL